MRKKVLVIFLFCSVALMAQNSINNYEYVIVSNRFEFVKKVDQYQTSSLTKFLLNKAGFKAFLSTDKLPNTVNNDRCSVLYVDVISPSGFFTTKNKVLFKDCNGKEVYLSTEGKSKEKEYKKAYHEAIRRAFRDPIISSYSYVKATKTPVQNKVVQVTRPIKEVVSKKNITTVTSTPKVVATVENKNVLYAQPKVDGFQLIDTTPKVVFSLLKTSKANVFILKDRNGILYLKDAQWVAEYYQNNQLIKEVLQIKF